MEKHTMSLPRAEYDALVQTVANHNEIVELLQLKHRADILKLQEDLHNSYKGILVYHKPSASRYTRTEVSYIEIRKSSEELDNLLALLVRDKTKELHEQLSILQIYRCNVRNIIGTNYAGVLRQNAKRIKEIKEL